MKEQEQAAGSETPNRSGLVVPGHCLLLLLDGLLCLRHNLPGFPQLFLQPLQLPLKSLYSLITRRQLLLSLLDGPLQLLQLHAQPNVLP